jgi:hypothetical protein
MPIIPATWEAEIGRIIVQGQQGKIVLQTCISKIARTKWTGSVAQEHLLCKCEAQSSNPSTKKKKKTHLCPILRKLED